MQRHFNGKKKLLNSILALTMAVIFAPGLLYSGSQSGTALVVQVLPEVRMEAMAPASWSTAGERQSLSIPVTVMIRLNGGTTAELSISLSGDAASGASPLEVETETGVQQITATPVVLRNYSRSGVYNQTVLIQRALSEGDDPLTSSLALRLISSDGAIVGSQMVILPPENTLTK